MLAARLRSGIVPEYASFGGWRRNDERCDKGVEEVRVLLMLLWPQCMDGGVEEEDDIEDVLGRVDGMALVEFLSRRCFCRGGVKGDTPFCKVLLRLLDLGRLTMEKDDE